MISNPKCGWCKFELNNFIGNPSYLTNVPLDLLEAFVNFWNNSSAIAVHFDEEGTEFTLVINCNSIFIIEERNEKPELIYIENYVENLTLDLIKDIESDYEGWVNFITSDDEEDTSMQRQAIIYNLAALKEIVEKKRIRYIELKDK